MKLRTGAAMLMICGILSVFSQPVSAKTTAADWKKQYTTKLTAELKYTASEKMFSLYDMDGNNIPELIISEGKGEKAKCRLYTCINGKLVDHGLFGQYGTMPFIPDESMIPHSVVDENKSMTTVYKMSGGKLNKVVTGTETFSQETGKAEHKINGSSVTETVFKSKLDSYFTKPCILLGRNFPLTKEMIGYTLQGVKDYKTAYKALVNGKKSEDPFNQVFNIKDITGDGRPELIINYTDVYTFDSTLHSMSILAVNYPKFQDDFPQDMNGKYSVFYNPTNKFTVIEYTSGKSKYYQYMKPDRDRFITVISFADISKDGKHTYKVNGKTVTGNVFNDRFKTYKALKLESFGYEYTMAPSEIRAAFSK